MDKLDLHNTKHARVADRVENFIALNEPMYEIITGNSEIMKKLVIEILDKHGMQYFIRSTNLGAIVVL